MKPTANEICILSLKQRTLCKAIGAALGFFMFSGVAFANGSVNISPFISSGSASIGSGNSVAPNLWFFINNNQSMNFSYFADNKNINYDKEFTYEIPYDLNGKRLPDPSKDSRIKHVNWAYEKPFVDYVEGNSFEVNEDGGTGFCEETDKIKSKEQCQIWQSYYGTRIAAVKSTMSIVLTEERQRFKNTRVGFITPFSTSNVTVSEGGVKDKPLPVLPLTADKDHKEFMRWVFGIGKVAEDKAWMASVAKTVNQISRAAKKTTNKNPFIMDPTKDYNVKSNPLLACRRNHLLVLSDGEWANESFTDSVYKKFKPQSTSKSRTLPDGTKYEPIAPYLRYYTNGFDENDQPVGPGELGVEVDHEGSRSLADITFNAWATDLDGNTTNNTYTASSNNAIPPYMPKVNGVVQEHAGSTYWHPYNDPAEWQHINTHFVGFDLDTEDKEKVSHINPPKKDANGNYTTTADNPGIRDEYLNDKWRWKMTPTSDIAKNMVHTDMASAAVAGRGRFYNARSAKELKEAIVSILDMINETVVIPGVKGSAGALASIQSDGNSFYSTRYDADSFTGELIRRNLFSGKDSEKSDCFKPETLSGLSADADLYGRICDKKIEWNAAKKTA